MSDPLSICASVIAVATIAFDSCKRLHEIIHAIKDAPKIIADVSKDLQTLQAGLHSLQSEFGGQKATLQMSEGQLSALEELRSPLQACSDACDEFKVRLKKILSHSQDGHTSFRDQIRLSFYEKEIAAFRFRLGSYKSTMTVALGFVTLKTTNSNQTAIQRLETQVEETRQLLSGQIQGLAMGLQDIVAVGNQVQDLVQKTESQVAVLAQCLTVCMTAWSEYSRDTGTTAKYVRALDDSRQLIGNIGNVGRGGPAVKIDALIAQNRAKQIVGNIEGSVALKFMDPPVDRDRLRGEASETISILPPPS